MATGTDGCDALFAPDHVHDDPGLPPAMTESFEGYKGRLPFFCSVFPDMRMAIERQVAEGDQVAMYWTLRGTNDGAMMGMPSTCKPVVASGMTVQRFENGKIAEGWTVFDLCGMLIQRGVIPTPGA